MKKPVKEKKSTPSEHKIVEIDVNVIKEKYLIKEKWLRGLNMLIFIAIKYIMSWLILLIAIFQFAVDIIIGQPNEKLVAFTEGLNHYYYQILNFLTYNTEEKPFPFASWPSKK